jgi:hypothetical protein
MCVNDVQMKINERTNECMNACMYGERAVLAVGWRAEGLGLYGDWVTTITTITTGWYDDDDDGGGNDGVYYVFVHVDAVPEKEGCGLYVGVIVPFLAN